MKLKSHRSKIGRVTLNKDGTIKKLILREQITQRHILNALMGNGFYCWRNNSGFAKKDGIQLAPHGSPDIIGWLPKKLCKPEFAGKFFGIEVKASNGRQTEMQAYFAENMALDGAIYIVARSISECFTQLKPYFTEEAQKQYADYYTD